MHCRYAVFDDIPALTDALGRRSGRKVDPMRLGDWLSGEERVVVFEDQAGPIGFAAYRVSEEAIELLEVCVDGDLARAYQALRDELWPPDACVRIEVKADVADAWRQLGFRDIRVTLEAPPAQEPRS